MTIEKLTDGQRELLFQLVRYQRNSKKEIVFAVGQGWDLEIRPWDERTTEEDPIVRVPKEIVELWNRGNCIALLERGIGGGSFVCDVSTFVLKQESLDYETFMCKPKVLRSIVKLWRGLVEDVPSLVWGIVGGVVGAVVTAIVSSWLGLNH